MACWRMNDLPDELLIAIFWPSNRLSSGHPNDEALWTTVRPTPRFIRESADEPRYQQSDTMFPNPPLPPAYADAAYNLLLASICHRWRRLAQRHVSTLLIREGRAVSREDLGAAVACFPHLTHLHLSDGSAQPIDDAFLARLAACCPKLTAFHLGRAIVQNPEYDPPGDTLLTPAGFDAFFRGCTQLEHLSLGCLHCDFGLPPSLFQLVHLRSLAVADLSAVTTPEVKILSALTAIAIDTAVWDFDDLEPLAHLPSLTSLSVRHEVSLLSSNVRPRPFSFARLSSLRSLDLGSSPSLPFDVMFPSGSPCSVLERVSLYQCDELRNLPHDIAERLPCLRELSISACDTLLEQPEAVTLLTGLRALTLARCPFDELPNNFGELPRLTTLVLHKLNVYFPASCGRLKAVETLVVSECTDLHELPHPLAALTALTTLCLAGSPFVVLPNDIGGLTNLHTLFLKTYRARGTLPSSFTRLASLARLELHECKLDELPEAMGELRRLRELYVLSCPQLQKLPESVAALLSLEVLVVDDCSSLFSVPKNLLYLTRLKQLELTACGKLRRAPEFLPGSLEILSLGSGAQQVMHLPGTYSLPRLKRASLNMVIFPAALSGSLSALEHLHVVLACEEEFPFPSVHVPCLRTLTLITTGLTLITTGLIKLPQLSTSSLQELCEMKLLVPELSQVPATIAALHKLTYLEINAPKLPSLPDSIGALSRLGKLILYNCNALQHLPASLTQLACLRELCVNNATITCLPASVSRLTRLQKLDLEGCAQLEALPDDVGELTLLDCLVSGGCDLLHDSEGKIRLAGGGTSSRWMY